MVHNGKLLKSINEVPCYIIKTILYYTSQYQNDEEHFNLGEAPRLYRTNKKLNRSFFQKDRVHRPSFEEREDLISRSMLLNLRKKLFTGTVT